MIKQTMTNVQDEAFAKVLSEMTDRELQEEQTFIMWKAKQANESSAKNISFLFWITIIGLVIGVFMAVAITSK